MFEIHKICLKHFCKLHVNPMRAKLIHLAFGILRRPNDTLLGSVMAIWGSLSESGSTLLSHVQLLQGIGGHRRHFYALDLKAVESPAPKDVLFGALGLPIQSLQILD